jgi:beta-N-acetylhexosaminidase
VVRRSVVAVALVTSLVAAGCTGGDGSGAGQQDGDPEADRPDPPTAAERLDLTTGWGPTRGQLERAARHARGLPLPRLAGQVIVADWSGTEAPLDLVRQLHLGGVVTFSDNVVSPDQVRAVNRTLQRGVRRPWPLLVSVDQEGGLVARVEGGATRFPAFMSVGAADDEQLTRRAHRASGGELRRLGFNVDFAPVADVTFGPDDRTIGVRSAGDEPADVTRHALAAAEGLWGGGVVPVLKHFPGHGSVSADSHVTLPVQERPRRRLEEVDWRPFRAGIEQGLPAVMVGHLDVRALDPGVPSSLSRRVVTGALRRDLGFRGLVVTDALDMGAVTRTHGSARAAVTALRAGVDVVLMPPDPRAARDGIVAAVRQGRLSRTRLQQAAARQIALLLHHRADAGGGKPPGTSWRASQQLSSAALTSVAGPCEGGSMPSSPVPFGDATAVANFRAAAQSAGVALGRVEYVRAPRPQPPTEPRKRASKKERRAYRRALAEHREELARWRRVPPRQVIHGTRVDFVGDGDPVPASSYLVAVDTPYVLGRSAAPVRVATYGDTIGAMTALVAFWQGRAPAPGRLPVAVPGVREGC